MLKMNTMTKIKGQNLRIFVNGACIVAATQCQIQINGNAEDSSTKDTTGGFKQDAIVSKSWNVSVDSLEATPGYIKSLMNIIIAQQPVTLKWDETAGAQNRVGQGNSFARTGSAYLTDLNLSTPNRQNSQLTLQFTGSGPLTTI